MSELSNETDHTLHWRDQQGITHYLRLAQILSADERELLTVLRPQTYMVNIMMKQGYHAPAVQQAPTNMIRMMLRILLPNVAEDEITTFEPTEGHHLLTQWWAIADTTDLCVAPAPVVYYTHHHLDF